MTVPRPASNWSEILPCRTNVPAPARPGDGRGMPVPVSVTLVEESVIAASLSRLSFFLAPFPLGKERQTKVREDPLFRWSYQRAALGRGNSVGTEYRGSILVVARCSQQCVAVAQDSQLRPDVIDLSVDLVLAPLDVRRECARGQIAGAQGAVGGGRGQPPGPQREFVALP